MKRTKNINHASFRKTWNARHLTPVALAISGIFLLSGCEQTDETFSLYKNAEECSQSNPGNSEQCTTSYNNALKEAEKTAPKYASRDECVAEFGENQCQQTRSLDGTQSGISNNETAQGSYWMPLMAGYMMGRMMGPGTNFGQQPLFTSRSATSPAYGKFVDASGRDYGAARSNRTVKASKNSLAPKPAASRTTTRGGFGETVNKYSSTRSSLGG